MGIVELFVLAVGLAMDAFAVSICKGLSVTKVSFKHSAIVGLYFGGFQAAMPLIGYFLGASFRDYIESVDHWIAFGLLLIIGANMIREAFSKDDDEELDGSFSVKSMLPIAVATSIDALAVGVTFAFLNVRIVPAISFIGVITFVLSAVGVKLGNVVGAKYKSKAEFVGGVVLIIMGIKILLEHTGILDKIF
ncbi:MAG: manganese efflux pump [Clostridia bacterium]|nr:manganese efflux pump [Clostridia bacterium]